jgi:hypothetical protein
MRMHSSKARMSDAGAAVINTMNRANSANGRGRVGRELKSTVASFAPNFDVANAATALHTSATAPRQVCDVMCSTMWGQALMLLPKEAAAIKDCFEVEESSASEDES